MPWPEEWAEFLQLPLKVSTAAGNRVLDLRPGDALSAQGTPATERLCAKRYSLFGGLRVNTNLMCCPFLEEMIRISPSVANRRRPS
jgi:hypothetical protein